MTWTLVLSMAATAYAFKALGLVVLGGREMPAVVGRCLALIPAALLTAIVIVNTVADGQHLQLDARAVGVGAATVAAWRRLPLIVVIVIGSAVTAAVRALA